MHYDYDSFTNWLVLIICIVMNIKEMWSISSILSLLVHLFVMIWYSVSTRRNQELYGEVVKSKTVTELRGGIICVEIMEHEDAGG